MSLLSKIYPSFLVHASGQYVGLLECSMGNSEIGHLTIGSGRIIEQFFTRINNSLQDGTIINNLKPLLSLVGSSIHMIIMISDGGIHSHIEHLFGICEVLKQVFND